MAVLLYIWKELIKVNASVQLSLAALSPIQLMTETAVVSAPYLYCRGSYVVVAGE